MPVPAALRDPGHFSKQLKCSELARDSTAPLMCPGAHATSKVTGSITLFFRHHSFSIKAAESGAVKIAALNLLPPLGKASPKNSLRLYRRPSVGILETIHTFCVVVWTGPYPLCAG